MKRFLSIFVCLILILGTFSLTAFADEDSSVNWWDYILSLYSDAYYINNVAADPDKLVDYWDSNPGKLEIFYRLFFGAGAPQDIFTTYPKYQMIKNLNEAAEGRYMVAELERNQLEGLFESFNDYWANNSAEVRNISLIDLNIKYNTDVKVQGNFGNVLGTGPAARLSSDISIDYNVNTATDSFMYFVPPKNFDPDPSTIYVYNGSSYYPPVIYLSAGNIAYCGDDAMLRGYYYVLNSTEFIYAEDGFITSPMYIWYSLNDSTSRVNFMEVYRDRSIYPFTIYSEGSFHGVSDTSGGLSYEYDYTDVLDKISKAVGLHITTDDTLEPVSYTLPDDIPYDEDNRTVVMVPVDQPGAPVYLSPSTYNNYVDEGDIYNSDDHSNNIVDEETVNNMTSLYNEYVTNNSSGSTYDDSKLMGKLDKIISKLKDIYNAIEKIDLSPTVIVQNVENSLNPEPSYEKFSDCVVNNIPIANDIKELTNSFNVVESESGFDDIVILSDSNSNNSVTASLYNGFYIDVSWYAPYRTKIRDLLKLFCYVLGIGGIWGAVRSVFGIHGGGSES